MIALAIMSGQECGAPWRHMNPKRSPIISTQIKKQVKTTTQQQEK
jgi:hypothetical protein